MDFKAFPDKAHYSGIAGPGWEEVADYVIDWAERQAATDGSTAGAGRSEDMASENGPALHLAS